MMSCACALSLPPRSQPPAPTASRRVSSRLRASGSDGTAPRPKRSSGTKCRPILRRRAGLNLPAFWPLSTIAPLAARVLSPDSAYKSSFWPLPDTPAMPTTSPVRTCRATCRKSTPNWSSLSRSSCFTSSTMSPVLTGRCSSAGGSAPIIRRLSEAFDSWRGSQSPDTLPARKTVQAVQSARISCNLWLMYKMLQPCAASLRSVTNRFSTACGVSTDVGSSRIRSLGCVSSARTISTRCRSPTLSVCTGRAGSSCRP